MSPLYGILKSLVNETMLGTIKKLIHFADVKNMERLPEDTRILVIRSGDQLPLYSHTFNKISGAVCPLQLFDAKELAEVSNFAKSQITPERLLIGIAPFQNKCFSYQTDEQHSHKVDTFPVKGTTPEPLLSASITLAKLFKATVGYDPRAVRLMVNNNNPSEYHNHDFDVITYTAQGRSTMCQGREEFEMPKNHAVLMKPGYKHKTTGEQSYENPRLTFVLI